MSVLCMRKRDTPIDISNDFKKRLMLIHTYSFTCIWAYCIFQNVDHPSIHTWWFASKKTQMPPKSLVNADPQVYPPVPHPPPSLCLLHMARTHETVSARTQIRTHIGTCTHIYTCRCIYIHVGARGCVYLYIYTRVFMCVRMCVHTNVCVHISTHICVHKHVCIYIHTYIHIYVCVYIYTYTYTCIYMYT